MPRYTRSTYEFTARSIAVEHQRADACSDYNTMERMHDSARFWACTFARDNPCFDRDRFYRACGFEPDPISTVGKEP
jgi:hypothetical protein